MLPLSFTRVPFGKYAGEVFDTVPLGYLDWLIGQDWLYGEFKKRLLLYINRPAIQRELEELFPDPEDDSRRPLFFGSDPGPLSCKLDCPHRHRWHGQEMPKALEPIDWQPPSHCQRWFAAWQTVADFIAFLDSCFQSEKYDLHDLLELDFAALKAALPHVTPQAANKAREKYRAYRKALRRAKRYNAANPVNYTSRQNRRANETLRRQAALR